MVGSADGRKVGETVGIPVANKRMKLFLCSILPEPPTTEISNNCFNESIVLFCFVFIFNVMTATKRTFEN